jgi:transmembrane sensor
MSDTPRDAVMREVARRFAARQSGAWSTRDEVRLQAWLDADAERQAAFNRLDEVWADAGELAGRVAYGRSPRRAMSLPRLAVFGAMTALLAALVLPTAHLWERWRGGERQTLQTTDGVPQSYRLSDGSRVELDGGSTLAVWMRPGHRELTLLRGEVLVTVAPDADRPLIVRAGGGEIADLGTRFDVEALGATTHVAVLSGRVAILTARGRVSLDAGQQSGYDAHGELEPIVAASETPPGWQQGRRRFDGEPLGRVIERLQRYHSVHITLSDPQLASVPVSGTFRLNDLPLFLRTLEAALPVTVRWADTEHVIIGTRASRDE